MEPCHTPRADSHRVGLIAWTSSRCMKCRAIVRITAMPIAVISKNHDQSGTSHDPTRAQAEESALEFIHDQLGDTEKPQAEPRVNS